MTSTSFNFENKNQQKTPETIFGGLGMQTTCFSRNLS